MGKYVRKLLVFRGSLHNEWRKWFDIVEHYDDPSKLPQAFICIKPKQ